MNARVVFTIYIFILLTSVGGFLLSLTGLSIGWMLGTLILAAILAFRKPRFYLKQAKRHSKILAVRWTVHFRD